MVDPNDKFNLIKRTDSGVDVDREYWDRVNQGDNVSNVAKMFENSKADETVQKEQIRVGKIKRDSFLENFVKNEDDLKQQIKTGKLNVDNVFPVNKENEVFKAEIKVGKLNTKDLFNNNDKENEEGIMLTKGKVGKIDPSLFESQKGVALENEKDILNNIVIGKLNTKNIFQNLEKNEEPEKQVIKVRKIKAKDFFGAENSDQAISKTNISVGKLKIKEEDIFENRESTEKPTLRVGKLNTNEIFNSSPTEENDKKFYKPSVQPKKIKLQNPFQDSDGSVALSNKQEKEVGKINAESFLQNVNENNETLKHNIKVGKLDTSKLFLPLEIEEEEKEETVQVGRINIDQVFNRNEVKQEHRSNKEITVGKLNINGFNTENEEDSEEIPKLRGARRINKGNRISCLIENLHSDKKNESDDEIEEEDGCKEDDITIGRDRLSAIQSMFSGKNNSLKEEVKVHNTIERKNIENVAAIFEDKTLNEELKTPIKHAPRKLKNVESMFEHNKEDYTDCVKVEVKVGKINADNIYKPSAQDDKSAKEETLQVGKLKNTEAIFTNQNSAVNCVKKEIKVGKIDSDNIFKSNFEESQVEPKYQAKVGKLNKDAFNPANEEQQQQEQKPDVRIGKINTIGLFDKAEENSKELLSVVKVGKLSEDKLILSSSVNDIQDNNKREIDTDVVPSGKVSERASAFLSNQKTEAVPVKAQATTLKRSESSLAADMQKKYQEQMQSGSLKRRESQRLSEIESIQIVSSGGMKEARNSFFQSMMSNSSSSSSAHRLGTSIMPTGSIEESSPVKTLEMKTTSSKKGKALFQKCAERQEEYETKSSEGSKILPGVDLEEIEDEFERLHREMMGE